MKNKLFTKRIRIGSVLGIVAGLLCFAGFSSNPDMPAEFAKWQVWSLSNIMMWSTIANRFTIGFIVALVGVVTVHPVFGFRMRPWLRGAGIGLLISLPMALGALMGDNAEAAKSGFWLVLILGVIIGLLIDIVITKFSGEGSELLK